MPNHPKPKPELAKRHDPWLWWLAGRGNVQIDEGTCLFSHCFGPAVFWVNESLPTTVVCLLNYIKLIKLESPENPRIHGGCGAFLFTHGVFFFGDGMMGHDVLVARPRGTAQPSQVGCEGSLAESCIIYTGISTVKALYQWLWWLYIYMGLSFWLEYRLYSDLTSWPHWNHG